VRISWLTAAVKRCAASGASFTSAVASRSPPTGADTRQRRPASSTICEAICAAGNSNGARMPSMNPDSALALEIRPPASITSAIPGHPRATAAKRHARTFGRNSVIAKCVRHGRETAPPGSTGD
jgi:hypothetical protein